MSRSPFVGPMCANCKARKLRLRPQWDGWIWCFGCGSQREVSDAGIAAVTAGQAESVAILRANEAARRG